YDDEWARMEREYRANIPDWDARYGREYSEDRQKFRDEIARFDRGLEIIRSDADVRLAFQLTNQSFAGNPQKPSWRLFQIVFLVSQIPGLAALKTGYDGDLRDRQHVDIIYFPTGGGKTEAYLGVIVFQLFLDRLRGKTAGVSVWTRFPLRLLTLQQTQRAADVVGAAELIRRQHNDRRLSSPNVDGFAIGYLAGQEATPNELIAPAPGATPDLNWSIATDSQARQRWKKVVRCPACRTASVTVDFNPHAARLIHRCTEPGCAFPGGELPVHVVDNDLFRYLPSVVVGTIDKLASLGNQRKMALLLGRVTGKCRVHGYCCQECCQRGCRDSSLIAMGAPAGVSGPTLFVQDELHLLKEGLGTFDAHYETFVQELLRDFGQAAPLKIVASSATIEAFERQAEHLYGRSARVFPGHGPRLNASFYAITREYPQRLYFGVLPHNKTIHNAMLELLEAYQREAWSLCQLAVGSPNPYGGQCKPGSSDWERLVDPYRTSLCYFSATRELSSLRTDLDSHSSPILQQDGVEPFRIEELSGSTTTDTVTRTLERLERGDLPDRPAPNLILATSMISHGVDIDRMNAMFFFGMPRQNAEYIQASSRVGRSHCGIVFTCMKPARERDQSHFAYFVKYHEFLGRLVEPVAINRWSKFSLQRTLPGLFMGVLLQDRANRQPRPGMFTRIDYIRKQISQGTLRLDDFLDILERAYLVKGRTDARSVEIRDEIRRRIGQFRDQIVSGGATAEWVSDALMPSPMRSLREVDEQVAIELDGNGSAWGDLAPALGE
ncbi:MAG TPA: helicase-related protein, partial [Candidatus Sulfotelmatobacter sp.]|nr:helicase-related protein [Candidatus Sulfotelmatobacter sp.]